MSNRGHNRVGSPAVLRLMQRVTWWTCFSLYLLSVRPIAQGTLSIDRPSDDVVIFNIVSAKYGSLDFDGSVRRLDKGDVWEFQTHLFATLHPGRTPNAVAAAHLTALQFAATNVRPDGTQGPVERLAVHAEPLDLELTTSGERTAVPDVTFQISKQDVQPARFAGIGLVGNQGLLWPVSLPISLTDTFR